MYFGIPLSSHLIPDPPSSSYFPQLCVFFHFKLIEFNLCCQLLRVESWPRMWPQGSCHKSSLARDGILCSLACLQAGTSSDLIMWCLVHVVTNFCEFICASSRVCLEKLAWNHPPPLALTIFLPHLPQNLWTLEGCEVYLSFRVSNPVILCMLTSWASVNCHLLKETFVKTVEKSLC